MKSYLYFILILFLTALSHAQKAIELDANANELWTNLSHIPTAPLDEPTKASVRTVIGLPKETKSASFTAANLGDYVATATLTVTDPTAAEGVRFRVLIANGTVTIGGTAYSVVGTKVERVYRSAAWTSHVYQVASAFDVSGSAASAQAAAASDATAKDLIVTNTFRPWIPVTTKNSWARYPQQTDGTITQSTSRRRVECTTSATNIKLGFTNSWGETDGTHVLTVKAAIEDDAGGIYPVTFSGSRTVTVGVNGNLVISDAVAGLYMISGKSYYLRTNVSMASGGRAWLNAVVEHSSSPGEGRIDSVDYTDTGTITLAQPYGSYAYAPTLVLGQPTGLRKVQPVIGLVGDSILDLSEVGGSFGFNDNWSVTALGVQRGRNYNHIRLSLGGSSANGAITSKRRQYYPYLTHVVCNFGLNDVRGANSLATIQANLLAVWNDLKQSGVERIWQTTITPDTSAQADEATRVALNNWIRTVPQPLFGIIEAADEMETSRNSGVWKTNYAGGDLYHPSQTGGNELRKLMPLNFFN